MKTTVNIEELMKDLDLTEMGVSLDPAPVDAGQIMDDLTRRGVLTAGPQRRKRRPIRFAVRAAVAAALVLTLSVTAWAVGNYTDFFDSVFGDKGLTARESQTLSEPVQGSDVMPGQIFETADSEKVEAALGGNVTEVGQSVTAGGHTLTVENCLIDENGVGAITYSVEQPEGLPAIHAFDDQLPVGLYTAGDKSGDGFLLTVKTADGPTLDHYDILDAARTTDTVLHGVYYFLPLATEAGAGLSPDDTLVVSFQTWGADGQSQSASDIEIPAEKRAPSVALACGETTARLSPLSLFVDPAAGAEEPWAGAASRQTVIHYKDGGEYLVQRSAGGEAEQNYIASGVNGYSWEDMTIFNRFVDTDQVADVTVTAYDGTEYVFTPAA